MSDALTLALVATLTIPGCLALMIGLANLADAESRHRRHDRAGGRRYAPAGPDPRRRCPNGLARLAAASRQARVARRAARLDRQADRD